MEKRTCLVCGDEFLVRTSPSRAGRGLYCSVRCRGGNNKLSHGHTIGGVASPTYNTWINMVRRCLDTRSSKFHQYGGVGITVCDRWLKFEQFLADMGKRPEGCTLDRIDGTLGYSPDNCRWADIRTQQRNTKSNVYIEFRGDRRCVSEWAEMLGLDKTLLAWRIRKGWTPDEALTIPPKRGNRVKRLHT